MHEFVSLNGNISPNSEVNHSVISNASLYGKGVFTTIAIRNSKPFLWQLHWRRLTRDAGLLGIDLTDYSMDEVRQLLEAIIDTNRCDSARCRITFFDDSASEIWTNTTNSKTTLLIQTADSRVFEEPVALTMSPYPINSSSPTAGVKSCNYLENILAIEEARSRGFFEAVRINERNEVASASMANVFWEKDGKLYTPSLGTGCLAGTMRELILQKLEAFEVEAELSVLENADSIFLSSAGIGIVQVGKFNDRELECTSEELMKNLGLDLGYSTPAA